MPDINEIFDNVPFKRALDPTTNSARYEQIPVADAKPHEAADDDDDEDEQQQINGTRSGVEDDKRSHEAASPLFEKRKEKHGDDVEDRAAHGGRKPPQNVSRDSNMSHADHGWSWVVLLASFFINMLILGISNSFSVYYTVFLRAFAKSKSTTTWIGSLHVGLMFFIGT